MGNKPLSPDFSMRGYQIKNRLFKERNPHNTPNPYPQLMIERATDLAFRSNLGILEPNRDSLTQYNDDLQDEITVAIRRNVPDAVEFLVDNGYLEPYTPGYGGHPIVGASQKYRSMLYRGDTLGISKSARILALLLVADPKLIDKLYPYQRDFITDPVFQEAIIKRTGEVAAKRRGEATTAWEMRRRNAINAANARRQAAAAAAPTTIAEHRGGLRRLKTQRRHRSTSAKTSKRLRRRTRRKSRK